MNTSLVRNTPQPWRSITLVVLCYLAAVLLIWPLVGSGVTDDWSIVRTAQAFADTGRVQYNGWEAPMLLWQVWLIGAVYKLFSFSYLAARAVTVVQSAVLCGLLQRVLVRCGIPEKFAIFGALAVTLNPIFLGFSVTAMTDDVGLLSLVCCFYGCLRALQARGERVAAGWLVFAAVSNVLIGSARQIDFVGVLILLPCTVLLLRRRQVVVRVGAFVYLTSLVAILLIVVWHRHQPNTFPQPLMYGSPNLHMLLGVFTLPVYTAMDTALMLLPVSLVLWPAWRHARGKTYAAVALVLVCFIGFQLRVHHKHIDANVLSPFFLITGIFPQTFDNTFLNVMMPPKGEPPNPLRLSAQIVMTILTFLAVATILMALLRGKLTQNSDASPSGLLSWRSLLMLTVPLMLGYMVMLYPRGLTMVPPDRYVLGFLPFATVLLLRFGYEHSSRKIGWIAVLALVGMSAYSILTSHDAFATFRASYRAVQEIEADGTPREAIDGGFEFNADTQVLDAAVMGTIPPRTHGQVRGECGALLPLLTPAVHARYTLAWKGSSCTPLPGFAPIKYRTWLPPFQRTILVTEAPPRQWVPLQDVP